MSDSYDIAKVIRLVKKIGHYHCIIPNDIDMLPKVYETILKLPETEGWLLAFHPIPPDETNYGLVILDKKRVFNYGQNAQ